jgi:hypothetical protein
MESPSNMQAWNQFFSRIDIVLHAINCVADCVDFDTMSRYRELKQAIIKAFPGTFMALHASHWPNVGVHANQLPPIPHKDMLSNHNGFDGISSFGQFEHCWICFPHLGIRILIHMLDVCLLRGAALYHHMYTWKGLGRFVVVPFADRHLFPTMRVKRPKKPGRIFGTRWGEFRRLHVAKPLPTF